MTKSDLLWIIGSIIIIVAFFLNGSEDQQPAPFEDVNSSYGFRKSPVKTGDQSNLAYPGTTIPSVSGHLFNETLFQESFAGNSEISYINSANSPSYLNLFEEQATALPSYEGPGFMSVVTKLEGGGDIMPAISFSAHVKESRSNNEKKNAIAKTTFATSTMFSNSSDGGIPVIQSIPTYPHQVPLDTHLIVLIIVAGILGFLKTYKLKLSDGK